MNNYLRRITEKEVVLEQLELVVKMDRETKVRNEKMINRVNVPDCW
jgi:hypothetical protein